MKKEIFEIAISDETVHGTDAFNEAVKAVIEDLDNIQSNESLADLENIAVATLALSCKCPPSDEENIIKLESGLVDTINQYNAVSRNKCYIAAKNSGDPMLYALKEYYFCTIREKVTKDKLTKRSYRSIEAGLTQIDLIDLHKFVKGKNPRGGIGHDTNWVYAADKLNIDLAKDAATRYNDDETKSRLMDPTNLKVKTEALEFKFDAKGGKKKFEELIHMMIGDGYEILPMDWEYLRDNYVTDNKKSKLGVKLSNPRVFAGLMKKVCGRIVTGAKNYDVETKLLKKAQ